MRDGGDARVLTAHTQVPVVAETLARGEREGKERKMGGGSHRGDCGSSSGGPNHHGSWSQALWMWPVARQVRKAGWEVPGFHEQGRRYNAASYALSTAG